MIILFVLQMDSQWSAQQVENKASVTDSLMCSISLKLFHFSHHYGICSFSIQHPWEKHIILGGPNWCCFPPAKFESPSPAVSCAAGSCRDALRSLRFHTGTPIRSSSALLNKWGCSWPRGSGVWQWCGWSHVLNTFNIHVSHLSRGCIFSFLFLGFWELHLNVETIQGSYHLLKGRLQRKQYSLPRIKNTLWRHLFFSFLSRHKG